MEVRDDVAGARRLHAGGWFNQYRFVLLITLACAVFAGAIYSDGEKLGLRRFVPPMSGHVHEVVLRSMAIALSGQLYGVKHDYTGLTEIYAAFLAPRFGASPTNQTADTVDAAIGHFLGRPEVNRDNVFFMWGEDVGLSDYARAAFWVFGPSLGSLYDFFFVVLCASVAAFIIQFARWRPGLLVAPAFLAALLAIMPMFVLSPESSSLASNRSITILGILPTVHAVLWLLAPLSVRKRSSLFLILQLALLVAVLHMRASAMWELATVFLASIAVYGFHCSRRYRARRPATLGEWYALAHVNRRLLVPVAVLALGLVVHTGYIRYVAAPQYGQGGMTSHSKWAMVFMGISLSKYAGGLGWTPNDQGVAEQARLYFEAHKSRFAKRGMATWDGDVSPWSTGKWGNFEIVVRTMTVHYAVKYPRVFADAMFFKLRLMISWLIMGIGVEPPDWLAQGGDVDIRKSVLSMPEVQIRPSGIAIAIFAFGLISLMLGRHARRPQRVGIVVISVAVTTAFSIGPGLITAPIPHGMLDAIVCGNLLVLVLAGTVCYGAGRKLKRI